MRLHAIRKFHRNMFAGKKPSRSKAEVAGRARLAHHKPRGGKRPRLPQCFLPSVESVFISRNPPAMAPP